MKNKYTVFYFALIGLLFFFSFSLKAQYQSRLNFNAKHEIADKVIHGAGQSNMIEFSSYASAMGNDLYPAIYMFYTTAGKTVAKQEERISSNLALLANHPEGIMPQIGLSFTRKGTHYADDVLAGVYDAGLNRLAELLNEFGDPVFVRIGYEANGSWNNYESSSYIDAFRYITDIFRAEAPNVATVWCTHPITSLSDMMTYYPGDDYVDWWSIDLFEVKFLNSANTQDFLDEAVNHSKPVMIGESTPTKVGTRNGIDSWNDWFVPYFNIIENNPVIKAFCYINRNWKPTSLSDWLDCRVIMDTVVLNNYKNELSKPIYQHATVDPNFRITALKPINDAYVRDGNYSDNEYGVSDVNTLRVKQSQVSGYSREAYFTYDLTGINNITASDLWLFGRNSHSVDVIAELYQVNNTGWDEELLTWNNKPATGNLVGEFSFDDGDDEWTFLDLSTHLINGSFSQAGFALKSKNDDENQIKIDSKEKDDGDIPFLIVFHMASASNTVEKAINQSTDDAEQKSNNLMDLVSGDLDLGDKPYNGIRFQNINIEPGASITNAYIQFTADKDNQSASASYTIYGEDVDNASTFTTANNDISDRTYTSASVGWNSVPAWNTAGQSGDAQKTPDISSIVQEIVDRGGWSSGNAMAFFVNGSSGKRSAVTFDGDPAKAPKLVIEYTTGARRLNAAGAIEEENIPLANANFIYPNPAKEFLTIHTGKKTNLIIYNLSGKVVQNAAIEAEGSQISISNLPTGFYLLKLEDKTYKLIKE